MTTLIVGCGYLGRRVGQKLALRQLSVIGTVRSDPRASELISLGIDTLLADVLNPPSLKQLPRADRLLYCVGFDRSAGIPMRSVYVDGLANTLRALNGRIPLLVYASATSVYGQTDGGWVTENSPTLPNTESGRICLDAENLAAQICREQEISLIILRYSGLYGPGRIVRKSALENAEPITGDPEKYLNLIHIHDAASAALLALDQPPSSSHRLYLATDDRPLPRREYYEQAARLLKAPPPRFLSAAPGSPHEANKRISNHLIKSELHLSLTYPDILTGLPASLP